MSRNLSDLFSLIVPENLQSHTAVSAVSKVIAFDDLGEFVEERERIRRKVEMALETEPKIDFSDFSKHVFYDSAVSKFAIAAEKVLTQYPFAGNSEDKDLFTISCSYYENYISSVWPRYAGYLNFTGSDQYVSVSDPKSLLCLGTSSLYVSVRAQPSTLSGLQCIMEVASGSQGYRLNLSGGLLQALFLTGSTPVSLTGNLSAVQGVATSSFNTYAVIYDRPGQLASLYFNTQCLASQSLAMGPINFVGDTLRVGASAASAVPFVGKIGDVRVLHTASALFHLRNFNRPVSSEDYVKAYYKFNEGITSLSASDSVVIDYSKSQLHGAIVNYHAGTRVSGASLYQDPGDPILYAFHPDVVAFTASYEASGAFYDSQNRNYMLRLIPEKLIEEDQNAQGLLISFALGMARYFDDLKVYIDQFDNLRVTNYEGNDETPDLMLPFLKKYFGWKVTDHFGDATPLEFFFGENVLSSGSLGTSLLEVRNQFWRRILNNLPYLYKTKGKRNNLDSFFNVLGINNDLLNLKEYGFVNSNSITDEYITKEKPMAFLGFGSGSTTTRVVMPGFLTGSSHPEWTIENVARLPYAALDYYNSSTVGTLWQMYDATGLGFSLQWKLTNAGDTSGYLRFKDDSYQAYCITPSLAIFDGGLVHIATVLRNQTASLSVRRFDNGELELSSSVSTTASGPLTSGSYSFLIGAGTGAYGVANASGYIGQVRYWNRALSASELDAHALNIENVGVTDPTNQQSVLLGSWPLNEYRTADSSGLLRIEDHSQGGNTGTARNFVANANPYQKSLVEYNFLSPSVDLKWTNNKVRVRNKTELKIADIANDTNQVTLEFNLVDALNEDIAKIFSTMDSLNNAIGAPVNKYRDEYEDLEAMRRVYFSRLSDSLNFTRFFKLFKWFDRKLASSIKQLLPARVDFIGGEFVVQSHFLERNKIQHKYPVFHTPKEISDGDLGQLGTFSGSALQRSFGSAVPLQGTYVRSEFAKAQKFSRAGLNLSPREATVRLESDLAPRFFSKQTEGRERIHRNPTMFYPRKVSGDTSDTDNASQDSSNFRNEWSKRTLDGYLRDNRDGYRSGNFVAPGIGNGFTMKPIESDAESDHGLIRYVTLVARGLSGSVVDSLSGSYFKLSGTVALSAAIDLSRTIWDANNVPIDTGSFSAKAFGDALGAARTRHDAVMTFYVSGAQQAFDPADVTVRYRDAGSPYWNAAPDAAPMGGYFADANNPGWYKFEARFFSGGAYIPPRFGILRGGGTGATWTFSIPAGKSYVFRDVMITFNESLTSEGVGMYQALDNQNNTPIVSTIGRNTMPQIEDGVIRQAGFNGWRNYGTYPYSSGTSQITALRTDSSGTMFVCGIGGFYTGGFQRGFVGKFVNGNITILDTTATGSAVNTTTPAFVDMAITPQDVIYTVGSNPVSTGNHAIVRRSLDHGVTWETVYSSASFPAGASIANVAVNTSLVSVDYDSNSNIFALGCMYGPNTTSRRIVVVKSATGASGTFSLSEAFFSSTLSVPTTSNSPGTLRVDRSTNNVYYTCYFGSGPSGSLRYSTNAGSAWTTLSSALGTGTPTFSNCGLMGLYIDSTNGLVCVLGGGGKTVNLYTMTGSVNGVFTGSVIASTGAGYFPTINHAWNNGMSVQEWPCMTYVPNDGYYIGGLGSNIAFNGGFRGGSMAAVYRSPTTAGPWELVHQYGDSSGDSSTVTPYINDIQYINGQIYLAGCGGLFYSAVVRVGNLRAYNARSFASRMLATSVAYSVGVDPIGGSDYPTLGVFSNQMSYRTIAASTLYRLNNIAEFPHYGGVFQMRNIIIGTQTSGKIGKSEDSIVRVRYVGSVVQVMWPDQSLLDAPVQGFGELSIGQSPGKLDTSFTFGSLIDVTQYDHMSLYCYALKQVSGTLDDIVIQVNRRPLSSIGFATDQTVEYSTSGSYTEARYKDMLHTKQVDYGDLTPPTVSYVIDLPLQNVREVRIGARLKNGQSDANQNFLVYGRFIKSATET